jgi:hypothetical protein
MLGLFYSLAFHMYRSLGGWPSSIGERGFPGPLVVHAHVAMYSFMVPMWFGMFVWPVAIFGCLFRRSWYRFVPYLALYALFFVLCLGLMDLAPEPFLYWWWD